jgi:polysaccharide chain length determinant protein (PEP-CTERM system associated)
MEISAGDLLQKGRLLLRNVWDRRWAAVLVAWSVALVCTIVIFLVPDRYEANARVYVDTQSVLKPLMVGLTYQPDIDQQVRMLARTLVSRPNVERLMDTPEIGLGPMNPKERDLELIRLMDKIKVLSAGAGNLYAISYRDADPSRARRVVEGIVDLFMKSSAGEKKRDSLDAGRFIDEQIRSHEVKLAEAENRLKEFKLRNFAVTGVSNQGFFARMSAVSDEVSRLQVELQAAERSRDALRRELTAEDQFLPVEPPARGSAPAALSEVDSRLESQKKQLDELLRRFTDEHPDVLSARRVIAQLELQKSQDAEERARAGEGKTRGAAAASQAFQLIRVALAEKEAQVAALRSQLGAQQARLQEIRSVASRVPQVEADLAQLNRDYDIIRKNYDQLVARRESASLGVKLDESSQLADFRVVEPPRVSRYPVFPGRIHLAMFAVVLSVVAALLAAIAGSVLRPTFDAAKTLREISGRPVLGAVSMLITDSMRKSERVDMVRLGIAVGALLLLQGGWVAWISFGNPMQ